MLIAPAFAQAAPAASGGGSGSVIALIAQFVLLGLVFYFLLIRPQQKKMKAHQAKIGAAKKGDTVVTGGGLVGKIVRADEIYVDVELAPNVKVKALRSTLSDVVDPTAAKPAND